MAKSLDTSVRLVIKSFTADIEHAPPKINLCNLPDDVFLNCFIDDILQSIMLVLKNACLLKKPNRLVGITHMSDAAIEVAGNWIDSNIRLGYYSFIL